MMHIGWARWDLCGHQRCDDGTMWWEKVQDKPSFVTGFLHLEIFEEGEGGTSGHCIMVTILK
jgi:hypothetical protein